MAARSVVVALLVGPLVLVLALVLFLNGGTDAGRTSGGAVGGSNLAGGSVPAEYVGAITAAGKRCAAVSAPLIAAQVRQESSFNRLAVSAVGAEGPSQFMPGTWAIWGKDYSGDGVADVWNPEDAIGSQADYMCGIAKRLSSKLQAGEVHGDLTALMLAGYNAGEFAVIAAGGVPQLPETLQYVQTITAGMKEFTAAAAGNDGTEEAGAASEVTRKVIGSAQDELGKPYVFGSAGPNTWDCSSLVQHAWAAVGVRLPRVTWDQVKSPLLQEIPPSQAQPGDIVFFQIHGPSAGWDHVGLVFSKGKMIEAPRTGLTVRYQRYDDAYYGSRPTKIMRVV